MKRAKRCVVVVLGLALLAGTAMGGAVYGPVDPANPYGAVVNGLFHRQGVDAGGVKGQYSIYVPANFQPWSPAALILVPDDTRAADFASGPVGKRWLAVADEAAIAVAFLEPDGGEKWNTGASGGRNESEFVRRVFLNMRSKSVKVEAAFTMDKYNAGLVGYGAGGAVAQVTASLLPTVFSGVVAIDASETDAELLKANGAKQCYPWPGDNWLGTDDARLPANQVPMPFWSIRTAAASPENAAALEYWVGVNGAAAAGANAYATTYACADPVCRLWVTGPDKAGQASERVIWTQFLGRMKRMLEYAGGKLAETMEFSNNGTTGFFVREEMVGGFLRRWMTYVPASLKAGAKAPVVLALHGSSASMYAIAEESRWFDLAEEYGFIAVFGQAYVNGRTSSGVIPAPYWNEFSTPVDEGGSDDVAYVKHVIAETVKAYGADAGRVYMTGHSNGANMSWRMGLEAPTLFAAIAPVGHTRGSRRDGFDTDAILPVWTFKGEYDTDGAAVLTPDSGNMRAIKYWCQRNGADETRRTTACDPTGRFVHYTFPNTGGAPLVRFTVIDNSAHAYFADESRMIWEDFFSLYSRDADGTLAYKGAPVVREPYRAEAKPIRAR